MSRRALDLLADVAMWRAALLNASDAVEYGCAVNEAYWSDSAADWGRLVRRQAAVLIEGSYEPR